jgi:hypothetical protein
MKKEKSSQQILTSSIENRHLVSQIAQREWISAIDEKATESLVSDRFAETGDCELVVKSSQSRGKTLVKKMSSLKNAFILSEILHRTIE